MTDPPERIVWFYGRHQPDLFCSLTQEIPSKEFYEGLPTNIEVMFDRSKRNICVIDDLMQSASGNQFIENLFNNRKHLNLSVVFVKSKLILCRKEMQNPLFEFNLHRGFQESKRSNPNSSSSMSNVSIETKILTSSLRRRNKRSLSVFILRLSSQFTRICKSSWKYFSMWLVRRPVLFLSPKRHADLEEVRNPISVYKRTCVFNQIFICAWIGLR